MHFLILFLIFPLTIYNSTAELNLLIIKTEDNKLNITCEASGEDATTAIQFYDNKSQSKISHNTFFECKSINECFRNYTYISYWNDNKLGSPDKLFKDSKWSDFYYTYAENAILISNALKVSSTNMCLSLFVSHCNICELEIKIQTPTRRLLDPYLSTTGPMDDFWERIDIQININDIYDDEHFFYLRITSKLKVRYLLDGNYWAIGAIEQCNTNRSTRVINTIISSATDFSCITLNSKHTIQGNVATEMTECPWGYYGLNCDRVCSEVLGPNRDSCQGVLSCTQDNKCKCNRGYWGGHCKNKCPSSKKQLQWGKLCNKACGKCSNNNICNFETGNCPGSTCKEGYIGSQCIDRASKLLKAPKEIESGKDYIKIRIETFENSLKNNISFRIQYKEYNKVEWEYTIADWYQHESGYVINKLKPKTTYSIRGLFLVDDPGPTVNITTKCDDIQIGNINNIPQIGFTYYDIKINFLIYQSSCSKSNYYLKVNHDEYNIVSDIITVKNIPAYTNVDVTLYEKTTNKDVSFKTHTTPEGVPDKVNNLRAEQEENKIIVSWNEPNQVNGVLKNYKVEYGIKKYLGCESEETLIFTEDSIFDNKYTIPDIVPYVIYYIRVSAENNNNLGLEDHITINTGQSDYPTEIIENIIINTNKDDVSVANVKWELSRDCKKIQGKLEYEIELFDLKINKLVITESNIAIQEYELKKLIPFTYYQVRITPIRKMTRFKSSPKTQNFQTLPSVPDVVENLNAIQNGKNIVVSWDPPARINGKLKKYSVKYNIVKYLGCQTEEILHTDDSLKTAYMNTKYTIYTVLPYVRYNIIVFAQNTEFPGIENNIIVNTNQADDSTEKIETIMIDNNKDDFSAVTIKWELSGDCSKIQGELEYQIELLNSKNEIINTESNIVNTEFEMNNLDAFTEYNIKITPIRKMSQKKSKNFKIQKFKTLSTVPEVVENLNASQIGENFIVSWKPPNKMNGRFRNYRVKYGIIKYFENNEKRADSITEMYIDATTFTISNVLPFVKYFITVSANNMDYLGPEKNITKDSNMIAPEMVNNLTAIQNKDTIEVFWERPNKLNGHFLKYKIEYGILKYLGCPTQETVNYDFNFSISTNYTIINTLPYVQYNITVLALNIHLFGHETSVQINTEATEYPTEKIENITIDTNEKDISTVIAKWNLLGNCKNIQGELQYKIELFDVNTKKLVQNYSNVETINFKLDKLIPFTEYELRVVPMRKIKQTHSIPSIRQFRTLPTVPSQVRDFQVFSHSLNRIGLRWKPPNPPNGVVEKYKIIYSCDSGLCGWYEVSVGASQCEIWEDYLCFTIRRKIFENYDYIVKISVKNKNVYKYGNERELRTATRYSSPSKPKNLSLSIDDVQNILCMNWSHPVKDGPVHNFVIDITPVDSLAGKPSRKFPEKIKKVDKILKIYSEKSEILNYSTTYRVCIRGNNEKTGENECKEITTKPEIPVFNNDPEVYVTTKNTLLVKIASVKGITNCSALIIANKDYYSDIDETNINFKKIQSDNDNNVQIIQNLTKKTSVTFDMAENVRMNKTVYFTVILTNTYKEKCSYKIYKIMWDPFYKSPIEGKDSTHIYMLFLLLLIIPIIIIIVGAYLVIKKRTIPLRLSTGNATVDDSAQQPANYQLQNLPSGSTSRSNLIKIVKPRRNLPVDNSNDKSKIVLDKRLNIDPSMCCLVKLSGFKDYVKQALECNELHRQHELFPRGMINPCEYGILPENKSKNRYKNIAAYDDTRVILTKINGDPYSDYINANFIDGYNTSNAYIATQGPKPNTVNDFWRMIWEQNTVYIVMLANVIENEKKKCEEYWPKLNESKVYGQIHVRHDQTEVYADYVRRTLTVNDKTSRRRIEHLHFTSWPDHGVPMYPSLLVPFLKQIVAIPMPGPPVVVHCSAGVGRTGTIILCDICVRMAKTENSIDVLGQLYLMRESRSNLVDNIDQYKLVHLILLESLIVPGTNFPCNSTFINEIKRLITTKGLQKQIKIIDDNSWMDNAMKTTQTREGIHLEPENMTKNRFQHIIPDNNNRIYISRWPLNDAFSDYINAVYVDGYRNKDQFIVTQQPMPNTLGDFWRMVLEKEAYVIVSLNIIDPSDETSVQFYPDKDDLMTPVPYLTVEQVKTEHCNVYSEITLNLYNSSAESERRSIIAIQLNNWSSATLKPSGKIIQFIKLWEAIERLSANVKPIIVMCQDGVTACGLFTALSFVIEKIKLEQECDVCLAVRMIRHNRKEFIRTIEQFEYLYKASMVYFDSFQLYSNFDNVNNDPMLEA